MQRTIINTPHAPQAIGTYSQAVRCGDILYVSGQIPLQPHNGELIQDNMEAEIRQVFENLKAIIQAAGGTLAQIAKLNVFLTDLSHFQLVNKIMSDYFQAPFPARAALGVAALPRNARVEMDCIVAL